MAEYRRWYSLQIRMTSKWSTGDVHLETVGADIICDSSKKADWRHVFSNIRCQNELMSRVFVPIANEKSVLLEDEDRSGLSKTQRMRYEKSELDRLGLYFAGLDSLISWEHLIINRSYSTNIATRANCTLCRKRTHEFNALMTCIRKQNQITWMGCEIWCNLLKLWSYRLYNICLCVGRIKTIVLRVQSITSAFHSELLTWESPGMSIVATWLMTNDTIRSFDFTPNHLNAYLTDHIKYDHTHSLNADLCDHMTQVKWGICQRVVCFGWECTFWNGFTSPLRITTSQKSVTDFIDHITAQTWHRMVLKDEETVP
jgi:hypothetical protein